MPETGGLEAGHPGPQVLLVTGRMPPGGCGVEDYAARLLAALRDLGLAVGLARVTAPGDLGPLVRTVRCGRPIVHLQYPTLSWRTSLVPHLAVALLRLGSRARVVVTFHEYSRAHWLRRSLAVLLGRMAHAWISTSPREAERLGRRLDRRRARGVVPIGSNIVPLPAPPGQRGQPALVFFGLLAPGKGVEAFLEAAGRLGAWPGRVEVLGRPRPGLEPWLDELRLRHGRVTFSIGLSDLEVSRHLQDAAVAYLPFPDGLSERRGSALAALAHDLQVVTTAGPGTTPELARVVHLVGDAAEAARTISGLVEGRVAARPVGDLQAFMASRAWPEVARRHAEIYRALALDGGAARRPAQESP
jgi:glycosyltransferase involved in cell wall biosynthesis